MNTYVISMMKLYELKGGLVFSPKILSNSAKHKVYVLKAYVKSDLKLSLHQSTTLFAYFLLQLLRIM